MLTLALISTVALLIWMGFFMMGSLPLLILKHDTPLDARFIRSLFNVYYFALVATAGLGACSYVLAQRAGIGAAFAGIAALGWTCRRVILSRMDSLRAIMTAESAAAIRRFRRLHIAGMVINIVLLAVFCFGMVRVSLAEAHAASRLRGGAAVAALPSHAGAPRTAHWMQGRRAGPRSA